MKKNQRGFTVVEGLLILVIVGIIGGVGYFVWKQQDSNSSTVADSTESLPEEVKAPVIITESDVTYTADPSWSGQVIVKIYNVGEDMPVNYGAPVAVRYNPTANTWETYQSGEKRSDSIVSDSSVLVMDNLKTATYTTGDGTTGELRIVFVKDKSVIQVALPPVDGYTAGTYKSYLTDFIRSIFVN